MTSRGTTFGSSGRPRENANPADVVASAWNPSLSRKTALPMSHGFGMTKQPSSWSWWNRETAADWRSVEVTAAIIPVSALPPEFELVLRRSRRRRDLVGADLRGV